VTPINLFTIIPTNFFTPLTSKHKQTYVDCLELIYDSYKSELSFGVDKEVIVSPPPWSPLRRSGSKTPTIKQV